MNLSIIKAGIFLAMAFLSGILVGLYHSGPGKLAPNFDDFAILAVILLFVVNYVQLRWKSFVVEEETFLNLPEDEDDLVPAAASQLKAKAF